jgi:hypothetical protein
MATFQWRAEFVLPGFQLDQELTLGTIHIVPSPRDEHGHSQSTGHLTFETQHHLSESKATARALSMLEPLAVAGATLGGSVGNPEVTSVRLDNQTDLETSGVRIPLESSLLVSWKVLSPDIDIGQLRKAYEASLVFTPEAAERLCRAARWLWKANSDADPYDQFLALWIAFNVLYGGSHKFEQQAIEIYVDQALPTELEAKTLLAGVDSETLRKLAGSALTLRRDGAEFRVADELQVAINRPEANQSQRDLVRLACLVIYSVRCDIVHAGGASIPRDQLRLIWASRDVLKTVLMHLLRTRLGLNP